MNDPFQSPPPAVGTPVIQTSRVSWRRITPAASTNYVTGIALPSACQAMVTVGVRVSGGTYHSTLWAISRENSTATVLAVKLADFPHNAANYAPTIGFDATTQMLTASQTSASASDICVTVISLVEWY